MPESVPQNLVEALNKINANLYSMTADELHDEIENCISMAVEIRDFMERND